MTDVVKIGHIELYRSEAETFYNEGKYLVGMRKIYQIMRKKNGAYYGKVVFQKPKDGSVNLTKIGRFFAMTACDCNRMIGKELLH